MRVSAPVAELEALLRWLRFGAARDRHVESHDRTGSRGYPDVHEEDARAAWESMSVSWSARHALDARVTFLRLAEPEAIDEWIGAHRRLLDGLTHSTEVSGVHQTAARHERDEWGRVEAREINYVDEDPGLTHDRRLYEDLFGFAFEWREDDQGRRRTPYSHEVSWTAAELEVVMRWKRQGERRGADPDERQHWEGLAICAAAEGALDARVSDVREQEPLAIDEWVDTNVRLLQEVMGRPSLRVPTEAAVKQELHAWERIRSGEINHFIQNQTDIVYDHLLYDQLFGLSF